MVDKEVLLLQSKRIAMTITEAKEEFLFHCKYEKNLSMKTIKAYTIDIDQFILWLGNTYETNRRLEAVDKVVLRSFIKTLYRYKSYKTIKRKLATLKAFFAYHEFEDNIIISPFRKIRINLKMPQRLPKTMSLQEIKKILSKVYTERTECLPEGCKEFSTLRDLVILEMLFTTGARVSEICNLNLKDLDTKRWRIRIIGKGDKERTLYICNEETKKSIREYLALRGDKHNPALFINRLNKRISDQSIRNMVKKYAKEVGIDRNITPHVFRHSFATIMLEEGVDVRYIQSFLGHRSISTTQIYAHVNEKQQQKIIKTKHPRRNFQMI